MAYQTLWREINSCTLPKIAPKYWKKPYSLKSTDSVRFWFLFRTALTHLVADSGSRVIGLGFLECFCFYKKLQILNVDSLLHSISCRSFLFHLCRTALLGFLWRVVWSWSLYCALPLFFCQRKISSRGLWRWGRVAAKNNFLIMLMSTIGIMIIPAQLQWDNVPKWPYKWKLVVKKILGETNIRFWQKIQFWQVEALCMQSCV